MPRREPNVAGTRGVDRASANDPMLATLVGALAETRSVAHIEVVRLESVYGTPQPTIRVHTARSVPHRRLSAMLHFLASSVEVATPPGEQWSPHISLGSSESGCVALELMHGTDAEAERGIALLRSVVRRLGWT